MFKQAFKNIDDILNKDAGCLSDLDYAKQCSWILFLKYLSDLAKEYGKAVVISSVNLAKINGPKLNVYPIPLPTLVEQPTILSLVDALQSETQKSKLSIKRKHLI